MNQSLKKDKYPKKLFLKNGLERSIQIMTKLMPYSIVVQVTEILTLQHPSYVISGKLTSVCLIFHIHKTETILSTL